MVFLLEYWLSARRCLIQVLFGVRQPGFQKDPFAVRITGVQVSRGFVQLFHIAVRNRGRHVRVVIGYRYGDDAALLIFIHVSEVLELFAGGVVVMHVKTG